MTEMLQNEGARPDVDNLLHDYFQSELPRPWPAFQMPRSARTKRQVSFWSRYSGRIALAACIALLAAGYLTLAGYFPRMQTPTGVHEVQDIGQMPNGKSSKGHSEKPRPAPDNR
jgi:hypothetical protein